MKRNFRAVLFHDDNCNYAAGIEERVDGDTVWICSLFIGPMPNRKQAQNELIHIIEKQLAPGDQVLLKIPDLTFYQRREQFAPRFTIYRDRLRRLKSCMQLCEDAHRRKTSISENLMED